MLAGSEPKESFSHTLSLFDELANGQEWDLLCEQAARHLGINDSDASLAAERYLALGLANSDQQTERARAVEYYRSLCHSEHPDFTDFGNLGSLLLEIGLMDEAGDAVLNGIKRFPEKVTYYLEIGHRIARNDRRQVISVAVRSTLTEEQS